MVPQPIGDNAQKQPLTIALKNICRDYPAGGGVLRELLQNADDAKATEVRFYLDEETYPTDDLIHTELAKYQGPALLAYNNAQFTDKDFKSLSRLGDSLKSEDGSTTGRFGRGFNSVYNWTDSPSIISRERFLILDPHEEWSPGDGFDRGGPVYDFVAGAEDTAVKNQMAAFQSIMDDTTKPLTGTIIRIPLRTRERAKVSDICDREASVTEIRAVLKKFVVEFGDKGLLFMRNVTKISIGSTADESVSIELSADDDIRLHKEKVNNALKAALLNVSFSFDHSFEAKIRRSVGRKLNEISFVIHHAIRGVSLDNDMQIWATANKYIPWAAVAAQISHSQSFQGSLFTVLPLPILINQPVSIHGQFSLSPDRASFYSQESSAKWNKWLIKNPVTSAVANTLLHLARLHPNKPNFPWFPLPIDNPNDDFNDLLDATLQVIQRDCLPIWYTENGYYPTKEGFLNVGEKSVALKKAFGEAGIPIIYAPDRLQRSIEPIFTERTLNPKRVYAFLLNKNDLIRDWNPDTKNSILEYLLSEGGFTEIGSLELFPFKDGKYRSIESRDVFLCRDSFEGDLFKLQNDHNIDLDKLSEAAQTVLRSWCLSSAGHKSVRYRSEIDFRAYCRQYVFRGVNLEQDMVALDVEAGTFVTKAWVWIVEQGFDIRGTISDLWLVPLTNSHHRKIIPHYDSSVTFLVPSGAIGVFMNAFDAQFSSTVKPLTQTTGLCTQAQKLLVSISKSDSSLQIRNGAYLADFVQWLYQIRNAVNSAPDDEKIKIVGLIASYFPLPSSQIEYQSIEKDIKTLQIFKRVDWKVEGEKSTPILIWTSLAAADVSIGLLDSVIAVPLLDKIQFLAAPVSSPSYKLLSSLKLAQCIRNFEVVEKYIIPRWACLDGASPYSYKEQVARFVVSQYSAVSSSCQGKLRKLPVIPVSQVGGEKTFKFSVAQDLINPSIRGLKDLFFDDEEVFPESSFFAQFKFLLNDIGLKTVLDEGLVYSRARKFANSSHPLSEIAQRAHALLQYSLSSWWRLTSSARETLEFRREKWLPIAMSEGTLQLQSPNQCRPLRDKLLVSSQLPVFSVPLSLEWEELLGWRDVLQKDVLLGQLRHGLQTHDRSIVDEVLTYVVRNDQISSLIGDLQSLPFILTSRGLFAPATKAFRASPNDTSGCEGLYPYLGIVDETFWDKHRTLLERMEIKEKPYLGDLLDVQQTLETKVPLSDSDTVVAVELLRLFSRLPKSSRSGMKVLSDDGKFWLLHEVSHNDLGRFKPKEKVNLTHPDIPIRYIQRLGIESLHQRLMKGLLNINDDDDDEFEQHEKVTTRIADTLDRYTLDSTFREYLANADDTMGTSNISWLLDERHHADQKLVDPELKSFQGPALLVYNDGVFSDNDFIGFKNVGEGSKRNNKDTIGQYGRGSQTMYHWTDVPMILSGKWLLILDPQQKVLPMNHIKGKRKPGVKLQISELRNICPDQLEPFEGLWGYNRDLDNYPGTIFRFPLRTAGTASELRVAEKDLNAAMVRKLFDVYFNEARISLLFLKRIRSIDFTVYGKDNAELGWSIVRRESSDDNANYFSGWTNCTVTKTIESGHQITCRDKWWVAVEDLEPKTKHLPYSPRRAMKNLECGIAGLVSSTPDSAGPSIAFPALTKPCMFSTLPVPILSDLPIYIHASFSLSGDRQSLVVDEHGLEASRSQWNKYLLQTAIPGLYLAFLDDIGPQVREEVLSFWPQNNPPARSCSEVICGSFWQLIPESEGRYFPKYRNPLNPALKQRPQLFGIHQAVFDFLPKKQTDPLVPLLLSFGVNLVRNVPGSIASRLKAIPGVKRVDKTLLRNLLKSEKAKEILEEQIAETPSLLDDVLKLVDPTEEDAAELDGCYILPLAKEGTIGRLRLLESSGSSQSPTTGDRYYLALESEKKLFCFAAELLVCDNRGSFKTVVSSGKFNLERLQPCHVSVLMEKSPFDVGSITPVDAERDKWLETFWTYWNDQATTSIDIGMLPGVYRATSRGKSYFVDSGMLDKCYGVIEPYSTKHKQICDKFPELWRFDPKFMPTAFRRTEISFSSGPSFFRLIHVLKNLAGKKGEILGAFVQKRLSVDDLTVLRLLLIKHTNGMESQTAPAKLNHLRDDLRSLPLWPTQADAGRLIPATAALIAKESGFLVPWMKQFPHFIDLTVATEPDNLKCLGLLGIQTVSIEALITNHILPLPSLSTETNWTSYQKFIATAASFSPENLSPIQNLLFSTELAVDRNRALRKANELFDHDDVVFESAFRGQEFSKFLHSGVHSYRKFWLGVGLRHRVNGIWKPVDFIQCLQSLSSRLQQANSAQDNHLQADCRTVLSALTTANSSIRNFSGHWKTISNIVVFTSRSHIPREPDHRGFLMRSIATNRPVMAMSQLVSYKHVAVCWSQTPFATHEPTAEVFAAIRGGDPPIEMVWKHLEYLAKMAPELRLNQTTEFLEDLHLTYAYLQDHLKECSAGFVSRSKKEIWLNIDSVPGQQPVLMEVKSSWLEIESLNLSILHDTGGIQAIKASLLRYEKLLRGLGCASITWPTVTAPVASTSNPRMAGVRKIRAETKMLFDITFRSNGPDIQAHRLILAATGSEQLIAQWNGRFLSEAVITYTDDIMTHHTLSTMIDYAYEEEIDWAKMTALPSDDAAMRARKLDMLIDLHQGCDYWGISLASDVEGKLIETFKLCINAQNVRRVAESAEAVRALKFGNMCRQFINSNKAVVDRASGVAE